MGLEILIDLLKAERQVAESHCLIERERHLIEVLA
jgi:hypothetical protein